MRSTAEKLADQFAPVYRDAKGFISATCFGDDASGEYRSLTLRQSKEDIDSFNEVARPQLEKALSGIAKGPPSRQVFEVYEPKV